MSQSSERLATGIRINHAKDDAAGLSIAASLNAKVRIDAQAIRNVNDAISYLNVADGATGELKNILIRLRELSVQSSNGSFSNFQRQSLDKEAQALQTEYNRIIETTAFNGLSVFGGAVDVQAGDGGEEGIVVGASLRETEEILVGDGTFQSAVSFATGSSPQSVVTGDLNGDGILDLVTANYSNTASVLLGNGDGTFQARKNFTTGSNPESLAVADLNGDGVLDLITGHRGDGTIGVRLGNGDGTFKARSNFAIGSSVFSVTSADLNGDGIVDLVTANFNTASVLLGNGDGTFQTETSFVVGTGPRSVATADLNGDGILDLVTADNGNNTISVLLGNGDGTFQAKAGFATGVGPWSVAAADLNGDGVMDLVTADHNSNTASVLLGNGDGTFQAKAGFATGVGPWSVTAADLNGDGVMDLVTADNGSTASVLLGNGDGTFQGKTSFSTGGSTWFAVVVADLSGDEISDIVIADFIGDTVRVLLGNSIMVTTARAGLTPLSGIDVATQTSALSAQGQIDDYFDELNSVSGSIGVGLSRLEVAAANLQTTVEGVKAAESRITDVDIAEEATRLVSTRILQQAASGVLAHALKGPELALKLLQAE